MNCRLLFGLLALIPIFAALSGKVSAAVVAFRFPERLYLGGTLPPVGPTIYEFDVNRDGTVDVGFGSVGFTLIAYTAAPNAILHWPTGGLDIGGDAAPLPDGSIIGADPSLIRVGLLWKDGNSRMSQCYDVGCAGLFTNANAAVGLRFAAADGIHYGFLAYEADPETGTGWLTGWAYETAPDTPIVVQPIPEPSSLVLVAAGTGLLWKRNASNRKENNKGRSEGEARTFDCTFWLNNPGGRRVAGRMRFVFDRL
jgi:hypothetical protein